MIQCSDVILSQMFSEDVIVDVSANVNAFKCSVMYVMPCYAMVCVAI